MTIVITRTGKGSAISQAENDANLSSLCGINEPQTGATYTVVAADQNRTIEFSNASPIDVTMTAIATIIAAIDTDDFKVTLKNIGAGLVTCTRGGTDTFDDGGTTLTINQYESVTLQSDSTQAIWNVIQTGNNGVVKADIYDDNGNEVIKRGTTASAVNEVTVTNAATGNDPTIRPTGSDANINVDLDGKGTGGVLIEGVRVEATPAFHAYVSSTINPYTDNAIIAFDTEVFDITGDYDNATNYRFTPSVAGKYLVHAKVTGTHDATTPNSAYLSVYKNGAVHDRVFLRVADGFFSLQNTVIIDMNGSTDYIDARLSIAAASVRTMSGGNSGETTFKAFRIQA